MAELLRDLGGRQRAGVGQSLVPVYAVAVLEQPHSPAAVFVGGDLDHDRYFLTGEFCPAA